MAIVMLTRNVAVDSSMPGVKFYGDDVRYDVHGKVDIVGQEDIADLCRKCQLEVLHRFKNRIVVMPAGYCSMQSKISLVQRNKAVGLVIVGKSALSPTDRLIDAGCKVDSFSIPVALVESFSTLRLESDFMTNPKNKETSFTIRFNNKSVIRATLLLRVEFNAKGLEYVHWVNHIFQSFKEDIIIYPSISENEPIGYSSFVQKQLCAIKINWPAWISLASRMYLDCIKDSVLDEECVDSLMNLRLDATTKSGVKNCLMDKNILYDYMGDNREINEILGDFALSVNGVLYNDSIDRRKAMTVMCSQFTIWPPGCKSIDDILLSYSKSQTTSKPLLWLAILLCLLLVVVVVVGGYHLLQPIIKSLRPHRVDSSDIDNCIEINSDSK
jgi:hypothetical protein